MLVNPDHGPAVLSTSFLLAPKKKLRLDYAVLQQIFRIKNCCGRINNAYDFNFYYLLQNKDSINSFYAEKNTSLNELINNDQLDLFIRPVSDENYVDDDSYIEDDHIHDDERACNCSSDGDRGDGEWIYIPPK